jgi:hypothetical protein
MESILSSSGARIIRAKALCEKLDVITLNEQQLSLLEERFIAFSYKGDDFFEFTWFKIDLRAQANLINSAS